jgi:two-component sensor histidine kinase
MNEKSKLLMTTIIINSTFVYVTDQWNKEYFKMFHLLNPIHFYNRYRSTLFYPKIISFNWLISSLLLVPLRLSNLVFDFLSYGRSPNIKSLGRFLIFVFVFNGFSNLMAHEESVRLSKSDSLYLEYKKIPIDNNIKNIQLRARYLSQALLLEIPTQQSRDFTWCDTIALLHLKASNLKEYFAYKYRIKASLYFASAQYEKMILLLEQYLFALSIIHKSDPIAAIDLGNVYYKLKLYNTAMHHYNIALSQCEKEGLTECQYTVYNNYSMIYNMQGNLDSAKYFSEKAIEIIKLKTNDLYLIGFSHLSLGAMAYYHKQYSTSLKYYLLGLKEMESEDFRNHPEYHNVNPYYVKGIIVLADVLLHYHRDAEAVELLMRADKLIKEYGYETLLNVIRLTWSRYYLASRYFPRSLYYLNEAKNDAVIKGKAQDLVETHAQFVEYYKKTGELSQANYHLAEHYRLKDSLTATVFNDQLLLINNLVNQFQNKKIILDQDKTLAANENEINNFYIVSLILSVSLIFLAILYFQLIKARKNISLKTKELEVKNKEIEQALHVKAFLFKELHHRVKNNLQLIIGMMKLQGIYYSDKGEDKEFLEEMEKRITAISFVHHQLYQEGQEEWIQLQPYLEELADNLIQGLGDSEYEIELVLDLENVKIPISLAVPLGLITNEILVNSIKHGFKNNPENPKITITLKPTNSESWKFEIRDNGIGFPKDFIPESSRSMGMKVISLLAKQIGAEMKCYTQSGAVWEFELQQKLMA